MELTTAQWDGGQVVERAVASPSTAAVIDAVRKLDGHDINDVYLRQDDGWWLAVCGGPADFLVSLNNEAIGEYWVVTSAVSSDGEFEIVCGGQRSSFPASHRVTVDEAETAATAFAKTGERAASLSWARV